MGGFLVAEKVFFFILGHQQFDCDGPSCSSLCIYPSLDMNL